MLYELFVIFIVFELHPLLERDNLIVRITFYKTKSMKLLEITQHIIQQCGAVFNLI